MWEQMASGWNGWGWGGMGIGMALFWIGLIVVLVALVRGVWGGGNPPAGEQKRTALDILKERYARGEIGRDEFEQKKSDLSE